jgi:predicted hydrocarbon binding protein
MHGIIHAELRSFVVSKLGEHGWQRMLHDAGLDGRVYLVTQAYPDEELVGLVTAGSRLTGQSIPFILEAFGAYIVPGLAKTYGAYIDPKWRMMDLLEHTETTIHRVVRRRNPDATPPELNISRTGPNEVVIHYASARKLCPVAKGIVRGLSEFYKEPVAIDEATCMHTGASACEIRVTRVEQSDVERMAADDPAGEPQGT